MARPDFVRLGANAQAFDPSSIGSTPSFDGSEAVLADPDRRPSFGATRARKRRVVARDAVVTSRAATS
jgi:hypothetical protein